jgi:hypothetical protein
VPQQYYHSINACLSRFGKDPVSETDYIDQRERHLKKGNVYVKKSDPRMKQQNAFTIAYEKLETGIQLFGHIVNIFHINGLVLFAVQKLLVVPDDSIFYYENETLNKYRNFHPEQTFQVVETDHVDIVDQSEINFKVVYMNFGNMCYVCLINNFIECD